MSARWPTQRSRSGGPIEPVRGAVIDGSSPRAAASAAPSARRRRAARLPGRPRCGARLSWATALALQTPPPRGQGARLLGVGPVARRRRPPWRGPPRRPGQLAGRPASSPAAAALRGREVELEDGDSALGRPARPPRRGGLRSAAVLGVAVTAPRCRAGSAGARCCRRPGRRAVDEAAASSAAMPPRRRRPQVQQPSRRRLVAVDQRPGARPEPPPAARASRPRPRQPVRRLVARAVRARGGAAPPPRRAVLAGWLEGAAPARRRSPATRRPWPPWRPARPGAAAASSAAAATPRPPARRDRPAADPRCGRPGHR